ncbi:meiosis protein SPO22/ZIP4 like-domain-containing protein [Xylariomycetidae sp. FL2044]|nr:meiosis protein SPO22/ZIP4 like-domain-containing protein [Xylariomycetidae sp. FL2044]
MESNGSNAKDKKSDSDAKSKDNTPTTTTTTDTNKSPRKRRKVNHACVYCRRSERPCTRCIKRNIGHLCHDEPRDPDAKKPKGSHETPGHDESDLQPDISRSSIDQNINSMAPPGFDGTRAAQSTKPGFGTAALGQGNPLQLVTPGPAPANVRLVKPISMTISLREIRSRTDLLVAGFSDAWLTAQNQFHDMHHYNPQFMLPQEVTHEFNLLNDFLNTSLLDDAGNLSDDQTLLYRNNQSQANQSEMASFLGGDGNNNILPPNAGQGGGGRMAPPNVDQGGMIPNATNAKPTDKTREFYLQAADPSADPSGNDAPEARMTRLLKAKYDAGMLKPFNYIKGYARLSTYMDGHIAPASKQKILRQLDKFRPKFREKVQGLTDMQLVYVEFWFEKTLMEYDRVFAAMAVPACCWRRTGEIFRGNKEMAELLHVPVEKLRDGKISLHQILTEDSLVRYWEEFGTIAFDPTHDTLLTACALKNPDDRSNDPIVNCCFSFMIRRDDHKIQIATVKSYSLRSPGSRRHEQLDKAGTDLWNWCTQQKRQDDRRVPLGKTKVLTLARVFSFLILALAQWGDHNTRGDLIRLQKLAIKTGRSLEGNLEDARLVLQKAAEYNGILQNLQETLPKEESIRCKRFEAEYLTLRIALAWKEDRLDVAEHVFGKVAGLLEAQDPTSAENLADSLFEIGQDLLTKSQFALAAKWTDRAYQIINCQDLEQLSREAIELRLAISQALVQSHLKANSPEGFQKAENHVAYIEAEIGDKLVVLLLRLELLLHSPAEVFDGAGYAAVLRRMIRSLDVSDSNFKLMIHHIRKLDDKCPSLAFSVLDEFIVTCVLPAQRDDWIERSVILRVHMATSRRDGPDTIQGLITLLDSVEAQTPKPLVAGTALAIQQMVWRKVDADFGREQLDVAEQWCRLALHPVLRNCGPSNTAKIARKLLLCALQGNRLDSALEVLQSMSEATKQEPMTAYLAYKLALRSGNREMANECLQTVSDGPSQDLKFLFACCLEAQQMEDKMCALQALQQLAKKKELETSNGIHFPALLRVLVRLHLSMMNDKSDQDINHEMLIDDLIAVLEGVLYATLRRIVNYIWHLERFDQEKLAKYMRCLLKATLPLEPDLSLKIIQATCDQVKQSAGTMKACSALDTEWFATTAFNHGIDLYGNHEDELSKKWIAHAFTLAHYHQDGGDLERLLQEKHTKLKWDTPGTK